MLSLEVSLESWQMGHAYEEIKVIILQCSTSNGEQSGKKLFGEMPKPSSVPF